MTVLDLGNARIAYQEHGDPALPPLVLLHGLHGDRATVAPIAERLADRHRVIAPDALGHGESGRPGAFAIRDQAAALRALLDALGATPAALLGISMGSFIAARLAVEAPEAVSALVLVVSTPRYDPDHGSAAFAARRGVDLATATREAAATALADANWAPATTAERRAAITARIAPAVRLSPEERAAADRSLAGHDLRGELDRIAAPTLVLSGRHDPLHTPEEGAALAAGIPGARFAVYEDAAHRLAWEQLDRLVADVESFLAEPRGLPEAR